MKFKAFIVFAISCALILSGCAKSDTQTPSGMKLFSGENVDYTAYVPENWTVDMSTGTLSAYVSSVDASSVTITAMVMEDPKMTLDQYWESYKSDFESTFDDMEYEGDAPTAITLDGLAANKYVYTANVTGIQYKFMQVTCINAGKVYVITYTSTPEKYDGNISDVDNIIANFSFD